MTGWSFGLVLMKVGGLGRSEGNWPVARWIAAWTSVAAASTLSKRSNWILTGVLPCVLELFINVSPGFCLNSFSRGVVMLFAMVSGFAPENLAFTWMTG